MVIELEKQLEEAQKIIAQREAKISRLEHDLAQMKRLLFGSKSERFISSESNAQQLSLLEEQIASVEKGNNLIHVPEHTRKPKQEKKPSRNLLPDWLPREIITIYPKGYDENTTEKPIGKEVTEILEEIPAKFYVKRYERLKFALTKGEGIVIGQLPTRPIEKGMFGEKLLTRILIDKYCDHLPLDRQQKRIARAGIKLPYSTIADVPKHLCKLMFPLYVEAARQVVSSGYIQGDETPHDVLDQNVKNKTHQGWLWVYRSSEKRLVLFDYRMGRGKEGPKQLLQNFKGFLQTDGWSAYNFFESKEGITLVGCMAHARRYFEQARDNNKELAEHYIARVQQVYAVEREIKENGIQGDAVVQLRTEKSLPVLNELELWLKEKIMHTTPESPIGKAIAYSLSRWKKLTHYVNHSTLEIDNNLVENAIRPTVIGRKNYLFAGSHDGAQRSAMIYSFFGSCKMNNINPQLWMEDILVKLPDTKTSELYTLLPNYWKKP